MTTSRYIAIIPAAGLGTRFLPITRVVPKELLPILGKPALHYVLEELAQANIFDVAIVTSPEKALMKKYCDTGLTPYDVRLKTSGKDELVAELKAFMQQFRFHWVYQPDPLGLGHAVYCARQVAQDCWPIVVLPDMIIDHQPNCIEQLQAVHEQTGHAVIATHKAPPEKLCDYGVLRLAPNHSKSVFPIQNIIEKPISSQAPSNYVVTGRYLLPPTIFNYLEETQHGHGGEIQLTDALNMVIQHETLDALAYAGTTLDTGDVSGWIAANDHFGSKIAG